MQFDLADMSVKTGIEPKKLRKEIAVMNALQDIFLVLANEGQDAALFGGTALNKIYYGKRQRLSYDLDIDGTNFESTRKIITKVSESSGWLKNTYRSVYKGVVIDLVKSDNIEKPRMLKARSILEKYGYPITSVAVPSYSLEFLLAKKTMALLSRAVNKDVYDTWIGMQLLQNKKKYLKYLRLLARREKLNLGYMMKLLEHDITHGWNMEKEKIDIVERVEIRMIVNDVLLRLRELKV